MNDLYTNFLREISLTNDWLLLLPEIILASFAFAILGIDLFLKSSKKTWQVKYIMPVSVFAYALVLAILFLFGDNFYIGGITHFGGLIEQTEANQFMRSFFVLASLFVTLISEQFLNQKQLQKAEYLHLILLSCAGFMLLVQCAHFISLFVCLELVTVAFYVLVAFQRTKVLSLEAGLKYLTLGGLSSAILLFGIVLLYGIAGNSEMVGFTKDAFQFQALNSFISLNSDHLIVRLGALFVLAGIGFKIGLVPFQIWVPDVYQGAPTPTTSFLAIASKAAGVFLLIQLLQGPFFALDSVLIPILSILCVLTILFGNISATGQTNVKRLIGLSGISHAGYLLLGVIASYTVPSAIYAVLFYLSLYLLSSFLVFASIVNMENEDDSLMDTRNYQGLYSRNPLLGIASLIGIASLAGVPPLGGFIAKVMLFLVAYQAGLYSLLAVAIIGVIISIYYYFSWIRSIVFISDEGNEALAKPLTLPSSQRFLLIFLMGVILIAGLFPSLLNYFIQ